MDLNDDLHDDLNDDLNDDSDNDLHDDDLGESSSEETDPKAAAEILEKLENEIATLSKETSRIIEEIQRLNAKKKELEHQHELLLTRAFELLEAS